MNSTDLDRSRSRQTAGNDKVLLEAMAAALANGTDGVAELIAILIGSPTWETRVHAWQLLAVVDCESARQATARHKPLRPVDAASVRRDYWKGVRDFRFVDLRGANLRSLTLCKANFADAELRGANLKNANLSAANLEGCSLCKADVAGTNLRKTRISERTILDPKTLLIWRLQNHGGWRANLIGVDLAGADLRKIDFTDASLKGADLSGADLRRSRLTGADLCGAKLTRARLQWADLSKADLRSASLVRARLDGSILEGANLGGADLTGATLRRTKMSFADLAGASLRHTVLKTADLRRANLEGVSLTDVQRAHLTSSLT